MSYKGLPFPYERYAGESVIYKSFEEHQSKISTWVEKNEIKKSEESLIKNLSLIEDKEKRKTLEKWFSDNIGHIRYIYDFSGLAFGVALDERLEELHFRAPAGNELYPDFDLREFKRLHLIDKLNWLRDHCEFIPFRVIHEDIFGDSESHKWSHIRNDEFGMRVLNQCESFVESAKKYPPHPDVYYFIKSRLVKEGDRNRQVYYLKRDLDISPRKSKTT